MFKELNKLQLAIIGGALIFAIIALLILSGAIPGLRSGSTVGGVLLVWGFESEDALQSIAKGFAEEAGADDFQIKYQKQSPATWESEFLNAVARGESPDIIIMPSDYFEKHKDKLSAAPPILITEREIRQQYIDAAEAFLSQREEVLGMPLYADPLMLYWNKDLFSQNLLTVPPKTWDEFLEISQKITRKNSAGNVEIAGAALGRAANINHAPAILEALFLQSGEKIKTKEGPVTLGQPIKSGEVSLKPAESALRFISDFSNPRKATMSWSRALPEAKDMFLSGKLAMYIGYASEYRDIKNSNPHLNFAISRLPQLQNAKTPVTSGIIYALVSPRASQKQRTAWEFIKFLSSSPSASLYADQINNVALRRDTLGKYRGESVRGIFAESVIMLKLWPNPDPLKTKELFNQLIENAALGAIGLDSALEKAKVELERI